MLIRLRHPKGICTLEAVCTTVHDLQQAIYAQTQIIPSRQIRPSLLIEIPYLVPHHMHI